jgi:hypothetical protein
MSQGSESSVYPSSVLNGGAGILATFNRYGLPGLVIGMLFILNLCLMYTILFTVIPTLQGSTKAITEITSAVTQLSETIKDAK